MVSAIFSARVQRSLTSPTSAPFLLTDSQETDSELPMKDAIDFGMGATLLARVRAERRLRELVIAAAPAPFALAAALLFLGAMTEPAAADFRLCNNTASRVGVAIGYKDAEGWTTEGWWNFPSHTCETILKGNLVARFYYVYAIDYDRGGEWMGQAVMCTRDKEFTIWGIADCLARGFDRTGFFEVDTGEQRAL